MKGLVSVISILIIAVSCADSGNTEKPADTVCDGTDPLCSESGNSAPSVSGVAVTGIVKEGSILTGSYTYSDTESDAEGSSQYRWLSCDTPNGTYTEIGGATSGTYQLRLSDLGRYIVFEVTPRASTGTTAGSLLFSSPVGPVLEIGAPYPANVNIAGTVRRGNTLTANYTYNDDQGDTEGATVFQWQKSIDPDSGFADIAGATAQTYDPVSADVGYYLRVNVTAVAATGTPTVGVTGTVAASSGPVLFTITIDGINDANDDWGSPGIISYSDGIVDIDVTVESRHDLIGYKIANDDTDLYMQITFVGDGTDTAIACLYIDYDPNTANGVDITSDGYNVVPRQIRTGPNHYVDACFCATWDGTTRLIQSRTSSAGGWDLNPDLTGSANLERDAGVSLVELKIPLSYLGLTPGTTFDHRLFITGNSVNDGALDVGGILDEDGPRYTPTTIFTSIYTGTITYTVQ